MSDRPSFENRELKNRLVMQTTLERIARVMHLIRNEGMSPEMALSRAGVHREGERTAIRRTPEYVEYMTEKKKRNAKDRMSPMTKAAKYGERA